MVKKTHRPFLFFKSASTNMVSGFFSPFLHLCPHFCDISTPCSGPLRPRVPRVPRGPVAGRRGGPCIGWVCGPALHIGHNWTMPDTAGHSRTHRTRPDTPDTTGHNRTVFPDTSGQAHTWCCPKRAGQHRTQNGQTGQYSDSIPDSSGQRTGQRTGHSPDTHRTQPDTPDNRTPTAPSGYS